MKYYKHLWKELCSFENLEKAYLQARKHKSTNPKVIEFDNNWRAHLSLLHNDLKTKDYKPQPLKMFILRDPKTRVICVSNFRDRIVHHALVNVLQPIFEPRFIFDSYASRKGKGTLSALQRFDQFKRKMTKNGKTGHHARNSNDVIGYVLKSDIKHYFQTVDHTILLSILKKKIKDNHVLWLITVILNNYNSDTSGKGMPLGNWTSQFFANVYLNELDQFVKHQLKVKYYIRYVDDFVILHQSESKLKEYGSKINHFLSNLQLELHPDKCKIIPLRKGIHFLGFRIFYYHKLVRKRNLRKIQVKINHTFASCNKDKSDTDDIFRIYEGWCAYARHGNTYALRKRMYDHLCLKTAEF